MVPGVESLVRLEAGLVSLGRLVVIVVLMEAVEAEFLEFARVLAVDIGLELLFEAA